MSLMLSRRSFGIGSALAIASGCRRNAASAQGRVPIRFSGYTGNPAETRLLASLVAEFNERQSRIHVTYEPIPGQYYPKLLAMLVSGTAPDVFYLDTLYFRPFLAKKKILLPLDPLIAKGRLKKDDFIPELVSAFTDGGVTYGIPKDFTTQALFYNKTMLDAAGVPYPDETWDYARLREAAMTLTKPNGPPGLLLNFDTIDRWIIVARAFGAELFGPDGRCALASPEGIEALDFYAGLKLRDGVAIQPGEVGAKYIEEAFGREMGAMCLNGGWSIAYLAESNPEVAYGIAPLPRGPKTTSNLLFTVAYSIPQTSQHPEEAWELIEYLTGESAQSRVTWALPSRTAVSQRYVADHPLHRPMLDGARVGRPWEFGEKSNRVEARLSVAMQQVILAGRSSRDALTEASVEIDRLSRL